jgi:hydroxyethylthiazole kinase-like uncharacterized protein yjeF
MTQTDIQANAVLTVDEMYRADAAAMARGISGESLMEAAGSAIAREIRNRWSARPLAVLCGPGNNGGDGFVVARLLAKAGWDVRPALLGSRDKLSGDAALNAQRWTGAVHPLDPEALDGAELVVDALFGAGLARPVEGVAAQTLDAMNARGIPCVAVDVPSGVHGDTGQVLGTAPRADVTITFFRPKPGHLLLPGRALAGDLVVADIGIPDAVLADIAPKTALNGPALWLDAFPWPRLDDHKYSRGHAVVAGGDRMTGAARLAARGAARVGAGMVTIACKPAVRPVYAADMPSLLISTVGDAAEFASLFDDARKNAALVGPGAGVTPETREMALAPLRAGRTTVLDADALSAFSDDPGALFALTRSADCVLTPHEGEFARIFRYEGGKLDRARAAAAESGAVVLLKGADTVIAAPDGGAGINANAPATLATAGSGDVLAGLILGLLTQGMAPFEAACAAAWIHGEAAAAFGPGLVAGDLPGLVPGILYQLKDWLI